MTYKAVCGCGNKCWAKQDCYYFRYGNYLVSKLNREEVIGKVKAGKSLENEDLMELNLSNTNLSRAYFSHANLRGVNFSQTTLHWANFRCADLSDTDFTGADLGGAYLRQANLQRAIFLNSNLASAILEDANLSGANLTGTNIWNIAPADWKIEGVKCAYIYNSKWLAEDEKIKTRQDFTPGEFELKYGSKKYDVAISFAGTERELAEELASQIRNAGFCVFYDRFYPDELLGKHLMEYLDDIYSKRSRFCVILWSSEYAIREWTKHELNAILTRVLKEKGREYIWPIKVDNAELPGICATIGHHSLNEYNIREIGEILIKKLKTKKIITNVSSP